MEGAITPHHFYPLVGALPIQIQTLIHLTEESDAWSQAHDPSGEAHPPDPPMGYPQGYPQGLWMTGPGGTSIQDSQYSLEDPVLALWLKESSQLVWLPLQDPFPVSPCQLAPMFDVPTQSPGLW